MKRKIHHQEGKGNGNEVWVSCPRCTITSRHVVLSSVQSEEEFGNADILAWDQYQIIECQGCRQLSFRRESWNTEERAYDPETGKEFFLEVEELYPSRIGNRAQLSDLHIIPHQVSRIYRETISAVSNKSLILAGIGVRALVEAVCKERQAQGKDLEKRINGLVSQHVLTQDGADILHSLRLLGNKAAHEVKSPTEEQILLCLNVVEHLLKTVYILPSEARGLPKKKTN